MVMTKMWNAVAAIDYMLSRRWSAELVKAKAELLRKLGS